MLHRKHAKELTKHCCNEAAEDDDKMSNLLDSNMGKDEEARMGRSLRTSTTATMGAMAITVEAIVAKVLGVAMSQQGTEERGRWETHDNQLKLNNINRVYNDDEHNDNTVYDGDVAGSIVIEQTPA